MMCNTKQVNRWYYRCLDCLTVCAAESNHAKIKCACGGMCENMGKVSGLRLTMTHLACACDERCTSATGPNCTCSCGGENHGSGRVVEVVLDAGPLPVLQCELTDKARADLAEFRAAYTPLRDEYRAMSGCKTGGQVVQFSYSRFCELGRMLTKARNARSHSGRMKTLSALSCVPA